MNLSGPPAEAPANPRVALFVTCLVDSMRPNVGFATMQLLREAGCRVEVPAAQTCCGQPAFNSGDTAHTAALARRFIEIFEPYDFVVAPSGSCIGMTRAHYPEALADDPAWAERAQRLGARSFELMSFLVDVMRFKPSGRALQASATYHDSCSGLRELGVFAQPRELLGAVEGLTMKPLEGHDVCCGFGGTFCVKYPAISNAIVGEKAAAIERSGAQLLLGGDLGCLLNMAGKLKREGSSVAARHVAEVLAGMTPDEIKEAQSITEANIGELRDQTAENPMIAADALALALTFAQAGPLAELAVGRGRARRRNGRRAMTALVTGRAR